MKLLDTFRAYLPGVVAFAVSVIVVFIFGAGHNANRLDGTEYFEFVFSRMVDGMPVETVIIGEVPRSTGWTKVVTDMETGMGRCDDCKILREHRLMTLTPEYEAMLKNKPLDYNYISLGRVKVRIFYQGDDVDFDLESCQLAAEQMKQDSNDDAVMCVGKVGGVQQQDRAASI